jgi:hypothetical protein
MKPKLILCLALALSCGPLLMLTGCRGMGTQSFTAFAPAGSHELETSSQTVLDVTCTLGLARADYNSRENLSMLAPRATRWKLDATLQIERVVKGAFDEKTLRLHWLRNPTSEQHIVLGIPKPLNAPWGFTNGMPLRIGFDGRSGEHLRNLKILVRAAMNGGEGAHEVVTNAINRADWDVLRRLAKSGMIANGSIRSWENYEHTGYPVRVGKLISVEKESQYDLDGKPCTKYSFELESKDGTPSPHQLQVLIREEGGKSTLLDFWNFGW